MTTDSVPRQEPAALGRGLLLLMATATGLSVAGNYFAQPLLDLIGRDLHVGSTLAALVVTAAQTGYALGLILLVPLGDVTDRRRLSVALFVATAAFLALTAAAPNGPVLLAGTVLTALASVGAQVVVPYAAGLAAPEERGRVVGVVMSGILLGGLLARTASGALSELGGWRTIYWVNALLMAGMAVLLHRHLPRLPAAPGTGMSYPALLRSTVALLREEPVLRRRSVLGALSLASYSVQLTALTFLLARPPYGWSESAIGLFGLLGAVGVVTMTFAGRLNDRGHVQAVTGAGVVLLTGSWVVLGVAGGSLPWLVVGIVGLNAAQQAVLISNQAVVYALRPEARNRINSAFMTSFFAGGAVGSALTSVVWARGGWPAVSALGAVLAGGTVVLWLAELVGAARRARGSGQGTAPGAPRSDHGPAPLSAPAPDQDPDPDPASPAAAQRAPYGAGTTASPPARQGSAA
ncbi:MFS transporter [Streptomyces sp. WMMC500]|uniref:MFS transporter n=1 Tax=Streptomyces sp. WMMC500 TaxID=3015154 RepID=UPI00248BE9AB|nr:MFS transporter [Streptomyces sp. WMMC500]WBB58091.1 MFS transporter [Streptomyces sp. WMMC500]